MSIHSLNPRLAIPIALMLIIIFLNNGINRYHQIIYVPTLTALFGVVLKILIVGILIRSVLNNRI